jgi:hypothetical protein
MSSRVARGDESGAPNKTNIVSFATAGAEEANNGRAPIGEDAVVGDIGGGLDGGLNSPWHPAMLSPHTMTHKTQIDLLVGSGIPVMAGSPPGVCQVLLNNLGWEADRAGRFVVTLYDLMKSSPQT